MRRYFVIVAAFILIGITYLTGFFIKRERFSNENFLLRQENEDLRAQIQRYSIPDFSPSGTLPGGKYLRARVFSTYPFNIKNQITVDAGGEQGVKNSMAVLIGENILVGKIREARTNVSLVETIFDPHFELPVRISEKEIDSLLQGGSEPKLILIEKTKLVRVGDFVYSAGSGMPYGLKIGEVAEIKENIAGLFKEVTIKAPFNVSELREVNILVSD